MSILKNSSLEFKQRNFVIIKQPLSCKVTDKIEKMILKASVLNLPPIKDEAIFRIEDALGRILKEEKVNFNINKMRA